MNSTALTEELKKVVIKAVSSSIDQSDIVSHIYREFYDSCNVASEKTKKENELVIDALESIAQAFGIDYLNIYGIENKVTTLKRAIIKKSETNQPKKRYLILGYSDDCGHSHCSCVTSKDFDFVDEVINMHDENESFEHLSYDENQKLIKAVGDKLSMSVDELLDISEDDLLEKTKEFFKIIIADESISREEFSEYLECLIQASRNSGRSKSWVVV